MPRSSRSAVASPAFLGHLLESVPASLLVIEPGGRILRSFGAVVPFGAASMEELVGTNLIERVEGARQTAVAETLQLAASSAPDDLVGPTRLTYRDPGMATHSSWMWTANRTKDPELKGFCVLLLAESAHDRLDDVLAQVAGGNFNQTFGLLAAALRYPPAACEAFFLMPGPGDRALVRVPDLSDVPGPPLAGPWDTVWDSSEVVVSRLAGELPPQLGDAARHAGFGTVTCVPINRGADGRAKACLVVWSRHLGMPAPSAMTAIEKAAAVAGLAISHASLEADLHHAASRDALTGLTNRAAMMQELERQIAAGEHPAVFCVDLEGFRAVNESLGPLAGDVVLRVAARRLVAVMRPTDEVARLGPDEFALICPGDLSTEQLGAIAERVVEQLNQPLSLADGHAVDTGASIGIALGAAADATAEAVLAEAEQALGKAKAAGGGKWVLAPS